jgi:hypothetical protein
MKHLGLIPTLVCAVLLIGCDGTSNPAAAPIVPATWPEPHTPPKAGSGHLSIAGFVLDASESCIVGARVEVIDGPLKGESFVQTKCGFWDYGADLGYSFNGLPEQPVTLRATASGYKTAEITVMPTNPYQYTTYIVLTRTQ